MAADAGGRGGGKKKPAAKRPTAKTTGQKPQPFAGPGRYNPRAKLDNSQVRVVKPRSSKHKKPGH